MKQILIQLFIINATILFAVKTDGAETLDKRIKDSHYLSDSFWIYNDYNIAKEMAKKQKHFFLLDKILKVRLVHVRAEPLPFGCTNTNTNTRHKYTISFHTMLRDKLRDPDIQESEMETDLTM